MNKKDGIRKEKYRLQRTQLIIIGLLSLGLVLRLYRINFPLADWHSWRQSDTAAVSRIFATEGFDILHPKYLDISNIQTGQNNPEGYRFVEFPIYNIIHAAFYKYIGIWSLEVWGRLLTIMASLSSALLIYLIVKKYWGENVGILSSGTYILLPYSIFFGRTILPDTAMVAFSLAGIYFFSKYTEKRKTFFYLSLATFFTFCSLLIKPYAIFFMVPQLFIAYKAFNKRIFLKPELYLHAVFSILPFVGWRIWIQQYPEGIPASLWLLNGNGIRFRPAFFRWIIYERVIKLISGYTIAALLISGLYALKDIKNKGIAVGFILGSFLYVSIFATGNVQHDYYQILIIPAISIIIGLGSDYLWGKGKGFKILVPILFIVGFFLSYNQIKDYFNINNEAMVKTGKYLDGVLPSSAKVIAPYNGDTTFLYHINRRGWPAFQDSPENLKKIGATHLVLLNPTATDKVIYREKFTIIEDKTDFILIGL